MGLQVARDATAWFVVFGRCDDKTGYAGHVSVAAEILDVDRWTKPRERVLVIP